MLDHDLFEDEPTIIRVLVEEVRPQPPALPFPLVVRKDASKPEPAGLRPRRSA